MALGAKAVVREVNPDGTLQLQADNILLQMRLRRSLEASGGR